MNSSLRNQTAVLAIAGALALGLTSVATAHEPSGAIFTTLPDGSEVNFNHFASKDLVYLDGGPGPGAPIDAAGLDDGTYVFQVTDPSGKKLLSTDPAGCRRFTVSGGVITAVVPSGCQHVTGIDNDHGAQGAITVQLMPYDDTPNPGGVYKVWATRYEDYLLGCAAFGLNEAQALTTVDPGNTPGNRHGFIPGHSKTDNFKVKATAIVECDTRFWDRATGQQLDGLGVTWIDTNGASNKKYAYWAPELQVFHEAHVEAIEPGVHTIVVDDGPGYKIAHVHSPDGTVTEGPTAVAVHIPNIKKDLTVFIDVEVDLD